MSHDHPQQSKESIRTGVTRPPPLSILDRRHTHDFNRGERASQNQHPQPAWSRGPPPFHRRILGHRATGLISSTYRYKRVRPFERKEISLSNQGSRGRVPSGLWRSLEGEWAGSSSSSCSGRRPVRPGGGGGGGDDGGGGGGGEHTETQEPEKVVCNRHTGNMAIPPRMWVHSYPDLLVSCTLRPKDDDRYEKLGFGISCPTLRDQIMVRNLKRGRLRMWKRGMGVWKTQMIFDFSLDCPRCTLYLSVSICPASTFVEKKPAVVIAVGWPPSTVSSAGSCWP